jgi:hypothetical protein
MQTTPGQPPDQASTISERISRINALNSTEAFMALAHLAVDQPAATDAALYFLDDMLLDEVKHAVRLEGGTS